MLRWLALASAIIALDQLSKAWVSTALRMFEQVVIFPVFNITLFHNTGAAFSFLAGAGGWQRWLFAALALGVGAVIIVWIKRLNGKQPWLATALSLILGGAWGNLIDRVRLGHVVDFIQVHYHDWYFPTFNVADSAITIGAALLILDSVLESRRPRPAEAGAVDAPALPPADPGAP